MPKMDISARENTNGLDAILRFQIFVSTACIICCVLSIATRTYTRRIIMKTFKLEDCMATSVNYSLFQCLANMILGALIVAAVFSMSCFII